MDSSESAADNGSIHFCFWQDSGYFHGWSARFPVLYGWEYFMGLLFRVSPGNSQYVPWKCPFVWQSVFPTYGNTNRSVFIEGDYIWRTASFICVTISMVWHERKCAYESLVSDHAASDPGAFAACDGDRDDPGFFYGKVQGSAGFDGIWHTALDVCDSGRLPGFPDTKAVAGIDAV